MAHTNRPAPRITVFQEAIDHCRWKTILQRDVIPNILLPDFVGKTFQEILLAVWTICEPTKGVGMLTIYDLAAAIAKHHRTHIQHVYIIGGGPRRFVQLFGIKPSIEKIGHLRMKYISIEQVKQAHIDHGHELETYLHACTDGDEYESYICNMQKNL